MPLETMPNLTPGIASGPQTHIVALPRMCPVSGNPQPGSYVAVRYTPADCYLEVYAIEAYVKQFIGGWLRTDGAYIRDMEQTVATIAQDCAVALGVSVRVRARLVLDSQRLALTKEARP